jgi:hypothetical protein
MMTYHERLKAALLKRAEMERELRQAEIMMDLVKRKLREVDVSLAEIQRLHITPVQAKAS